MKKKTKKLWKAKELYGCGSFSASLQDLVAPPQFTAALSPGAPQSVCLVEIGLHGGKSSPDQWLQRQRTSHCLRSLWGHQQWSSCLSQRDSEPLPSLPAAGRANWEHPSLHFAKCKVFVTGSPACCVMPDILHVCCTGISISHLADPESHRAILNKARDHPTPCNQNDFLFNSRDTSLFMLASFFCSPMRRHGHVFLFIRIIFSIIFLTGAVQITIGR